MPLGGIGTGCVSITGDGGLAEWQIQNRPNQDSFARFCHFALRVQRGSRRPFCKILEGPVREPYSKHRRSIDGQYYPNCGLGGSGMFGFPRCKGTLFNAAFPFAEIRFLDEQLPINLRLEAYSPFIPTDAEASGIPCAIVRFHLENTSDHLQTISLGYSMENIVAGGKHGHRSRRTRLGRMEGLVFENPHVPKNDPDFGSIGIFTEAPDITVAESWARLPFCDPQTLYWDELVKDGRPRERVFEEARSGERDTGSVFAHLDMKPGQKAVIPFFVTWSFPNYRYDYGNVDPAAVEEQGRTDGAVVMRNHYAKRFPDAESVGRFLEANERALHTKTKAFRKAVETTSVPLEVIDAASSQLAILKSPTVARWEDGVLYAFEGILQDRGCCPGSCVHVWNYARGFDALFSGLQRGVHANNYRHNRSPSGSGAMAFRMTVPYGQHEQVPTPAADAQFGEIIRVYHAWKLSADDDWLRRLWPELRQSLEFAWSFWDHQRRGVIEGVHHNTFDIEFYGPDPHATMYYLGALAACAEMALTFDEESFAQTCRELNKAGAEWIDKHLFNGDYYEQQIDPTAGKYAEVERKPRGSGMDEFAADMPLYQFGKGCLSDQLAGYWLATQAGLDPLLEEVHVRKTLHSIFWHNFFPDVAAYDNHQRAYALPGEGALVLCRWPRGGKPRLPFPYADEAWAGVEYEVASLCAMNGLEREALAIVSALRKRYDGRNRNPFNEVESGGFYARSLASWGLMLAFSGFRYDAHAAEMTFRLAERKTSRWFWATDDAWGTFHCNASQTSATLEVLHGSLRLSALRLNVMRSFQFTSARLDLPVNIESGAGTKDAVSLECSGQILRLNATISLPEGASLSFAGE